MMIFIISFFFISPLHVWWRFPCIIKDDSGEGLTQRTLKQLNKRATNSGRMEKLS